MERRISWERLGIGITTLLSLFVLIGAAGCDEKTALPPAPGLMEYMKPLVFTLPNSRVSLATGNLQVKRTDFILETEIGSVEVGAVYNSATDQWLWNFDMTHNGHHFTDLTGAFHDISHVGIGDEIPGTQWVVAGPGTMRTKSGRTFSFSGGLLQAIHWANQPYPRLKMVRDGADQRVVAMQVCYELGCNDALLELNYDELGRLTHMQDAADREALFDYDEGGQLIAARDGLDIAEGWPGWSYGYSTHATETRRMSSMTNSEGERVEFEFEGSRGQLSRFTRIGENNPTHEFAYSQFEPGKFETVVTQPDGSHKRYRFDSVWRTASIENEVGDVETFEWIGMKIASQTDAAGLQTRWKYRVGKQHVPGYGYISALETVTETQPSGNVVVTIFQRTAVHLEEDDTWPVLSISDELGTMETREYDEHGRLIVIANGADEGYSMIYESNLVIPSTVYRSRDGFSVTAYPNEHGKPGGWIGLPVTMGGMAWLPPWEYDAAGNLTKGRGISTPTSAGRPGIVARGFDANRFLKSIELFSEESATTETLTIERRSDGQPVRFSRPHGGDTEFEYDALGRQIARRERVDGLWQTTVFAYDERDRQTAVERPNGMRTETEYDAAGQTTEIQHLQDGILEKVVSNTWDRGFLVERSDTSYPGSESLVYDAAGRVSAIHYPHGEALEIEYDLRGRIATKRYWLANGSLLRTLGFAYDEAGRQQILREDGVVLIEWHYGKASNESSVVGWNRGIGSLEWIRYGNDLLRTFEQTKGIDPLGSYRNSQTGGGTVEDTYIFSQMDCYPETEIPIDCIRITETALPTGRTDHVPVERYELSPGHRVSQSNGTTHLLETRLAAPRVVASGVWASDQLETTAYSHGHDALANQVGFDFRYNEERNRLLEGSGHSYTYDEAGFVLARDELLLVWDAMGRIARIGNDQYTWDSLGRPTSRIAAGVETRYLFGGTVEANSEMNPTALDLGDVRIDFENADHHYRHFDFRNNVQFVTNDAGEVIRAFTYSAYGLESSYNAATDTITFAQGEPLGSVVRLGVRLYDPAIGRFLSPDPLYQVVNQYNYAEGNPVEFWDPGGELSITIIFPGNREMWIRVRCGLGFESGLVVAWIAAVRHRRRVKRNAKADPS